MTTGFGYLAAAVAGDVRGVPRRGVESAEELRAQFMPLEDVRDALGPARVLHHATELAGIAPTGPIPPLRADR